MDFLKQIFQRAKNDLQTIVLPESTDERVVRAAAMIQKEGIARVILIGNKKNISELAGGLDVSKVEIIEPGTDIEYYCNMLYELRKDKGMTLEKAKEILKDPIYFGVMMVKAKKADGLVAGSINSTANTLRPALQILKVAPGTSLVSAFFLMTVPNCEHGHNGIFIFADSGLIENPTAQQLADIAISSANSFELLVQAQPKVAMLSYSTYKSAKSELVDKVIQATEIAKEKAPQLIIDGELQVDAAIVPEVSKMKAPGSSLQGEANVLIFPDLNCGNIGYKLTQRLAKAYAYGPITQGMSMPVNDLSRGCTSDDIMGVVAITAVQAQSAKHKK